jgi:hypothetical protein
MPFPMFLNYIKFIILHHSLLSTPLPFPGKVSTGIIFAFTYVCTPDFHHIHPPTPFSTNLSPLTGAKTPHLGRTYFTLLFSNFVEEIREKMKRKKNTIFCLF